MKIHAISLAAAMLAMTLAAPAQAALVCKPPMIGAYAGFAGSKEGAGGPARAAWQVKVAAKWGPSWSNWGNSKNRSYKCRKRTNALGVNGWSCRARAKPCKHQ